MKHKKQIFSLILTTVMVLSIVTTSALAVDNDDTDSIAVPVEYTLSVDSGEGMSLWAYKTEGGTYFKLRDIAMALNGTEKQFDIEWSEESRVVYLSKDCAYTPVGGELSKPEQTGSTEARYTDCSIRCLNNWNNILAYLIDDTHYVKLSDLAVVIGFSAGYDTEARSVAIDTSPEAVTVAYTGEAINNIALMDTDNLYSLNDDGTVVIHYADGTEAEAPLTLESIENITWTGRIAEESGFFISEEKTAVAYYDTDGAVRVITSENMGEIWETSEVIARNVGVSDMYIGFSTQNDGWLVICNFHGLGSESHYIYQTSDGGKIWTQIGNPNELYSRVLTGAGFAAGDIGFLCFRFETECSPAICLTMDRGLTWEKVSVEIPEEFDSYYSRTALSPVFSGADGVMPVELINNNGDTITIYFTSEDYGMTWIYDEEFNQPHQI